MLLASSAAVVGLLIFFLVFIPAVIGAAAAVTWVVVRVSDPARRKQRIEAPEPEVAPEPEPLPTPAQPTQKKGPAQGAKGQPKKKRRHGR